MNIETARVAGTLAAKIDALSQLLAKIEAAEAAGGWAAQSIIAVSADGGERIDVLPFGPANAETSALVLATARQTYRAQHDALAAELAALVDAPAV